MEVVWSGFDSQFGFRLSAVRFSLRRTGLEGSVGMDVVWSEFDSQFGSRSSAVRFSRTS